MPKKPRYVVRGPMARVGRNTVAHLRVETVINWDECWHCAGCNGPAPELTPWLLDVLESVASGHTRLAGTEIGRAFAAACRRVERADLPPPERCL